MKKTNLIFAMFLFLAFSAFGQKDGTGKSEMGAPNMSREDTSIYDFTTVEKAPEYPEGQDGLMRFISKN